MFIKTYMCSMSIAFADWCKVMVPIPAPPFFVVVPMPFLNIALSCVAIPNIFNIFVAGVPTHNVLTITPMSSGNEISAPLGGVVSQMFCGAQRNITCSLKVLQGGAPVTRLLDVSGQNGFIPNWPLGITITPSQFKIMVMT